jgi:hypothetical protein
MPFFIGAPHQYVILASAGTHATSTASRIPYASNKKRIKKSIKRTDMYQIDDNFIKM